MTASAHPVFVRLRAAAADGPVVVAHRGDSRNHPENTVAAFRAASALGVAMQEFDVQASRDGVLVCMHDTTLDRTTDAAVRLGPGALVAQVTSAELAQLDAGRWKGDAHRGERVPTLIDALAAMPAPCIAMVEHKAGSAESFVATMRHGGRLDGCILQSFDWEFVASARRVAGDLALALLGPTPAHPRADDSVVQAAFALGAGMVHWHANELGRADVRRLHAAGMLVCTYTTDDELGWCGGAALGVDAMCTNDPAVMMERRRAGELRRSRPGNG